MLVVRVYAESAETKTYRDPNDGCQGEGMAYFLKVNGMYQGKITDCYPAEGETTMFTTDAGNVFEGTIWDRGQKLTGNFTMIDGTIINGEIVGFERDGIYTFSYADGTVCEENW